MNIRKLRKDRGWLQRDLGFYAKINPSIISQIETGRLNPSEKQIKNIAAALKVKPESLNLQTAPEA